ncbi:putative Sar1 GTPase [Ordospora colligata]|uniref:Small COPII coat GTPase SAR1 n=1 Tax=Ordospora colligata OC4 TaxID=1354746 RepID=A0A0B2UND7_9MICR|nr:putative Sar1 GTPase [Ordospora colligata OC4]KHN70592.1 putative Sar1 GTPase [Ordospora colligata OC4]TBU17342.1 putative Sar1 GTPase [Ordospora colligata]TBU17592.1 putative Sar1 GTPase [Ordospora colligata]TBU19772.1 putative Sar1 GTPase [Ordospora colligata]
MLDNINEYFGLVKNKLSEVYEKIFQNFIKSLFGKPSSILFLGIDNAGKTTLVNKLKSNSTSAYMPTKHPNTYQVEIGNLKAQVVDLGGHSAVRIVWREYFYNCDGIVFIVDVHDNKRFNEVREAYKTVREMEKNAPIVVLMNKVDLVKHTPESAEQDYEWNSALREATGIENQEDPDAGQAVKIFYVKMLKDDGDSNSITGPLARAFKWLETMITYSGKKQSSLNKTL